MQQLKGNRAVVSLEQYRQSKLGLGRPSLIIDLLDDGTVDVDVKGIDSKNAYRAAVGCYIAMGELLKRMKENK